MASEHVLAMFKKSMEAPDAEQGAASGIAAKAGELGQSKVFQSLVFILSLVLPAAFTAIGAMYLDQCKIQQLIPIWLLVHGVANILFVVASRLSTIDTEDTKFKIIKFFKGILELFVFCWFITGNVWVFRVWSEDPDFEDMSSEKSCNPTVFYMAFIGGVLFPYMLAGFMCITICCCAVCCGIMASKK